MTERVHQNGYNEKEVKAGKFYIPSRDNLRVDHDWHQDCYLVCKYVKIDVRAYWCDKHNQWVYEHPVRIDYVFQNGEVKVKK